MTYKELLDAILDAETETDLSALGKMLRVYHDALENPPQGVVGVGAITYAERTLAEWNLDK